MSSKKRPEIKFNKTKEPGGGSKDSRETSNPRQDKLQRKTTTGRQGTGISQPQGACGTSADETQNRPSAQDGGLTKQNKEQKENWRKKPRQVTKGKTQGPSNEEGKPSSDRKATLQPNKGGKQKTTTPEKQSSDFPTKTGRTSEGGNFNKHKQDPKGRGRGASREVNKGKVLPSSSAKGKPPGKNQDHRPGKANPANTKHQTQPPLPCKQHKNYQKPSFPRKRNDLDLSILKEKDCIKVVHELNESLDRFKFFLRSQEQQHRSDEFIFDLTCTLAIACEAPSNENTNKILAALKGSAFFSAKIPYLLDRVQTTTALNDPESRRLFIGWLIKVFTRYLKQLPSSYADPPYDQLKQTLEQSNIDGKDELKKQLNDFKQVRDDIIKAERAKHGKRYTSKTAQKPPNDFREIPICPTNKEIKSQEPPFLRKNIKKGRYEDVEHYLDVQFRLLREDFLEPLREGIYEITHKVPREQRNQLMKCYQRVLIVGKEFTSSGINYEVRFDVSQFGMTNWAQSKRLIFGSFLCLSKDNFETLLFATVANRDPKELQKGKFYIQFLERQNIFEIERRREQYQLVESPAFFEAYRHVLKGLQGLNETNIPFTKYLVECSAEVDPPEYLMREGDQDPVCYDLSKALDVPNLPEAKKVPVLEPEAWPSVDTLHLNSSQLEALRTAVSTEFSVIQGPPGTGKTYVGAKIVRCLLDNRRQWDPRRTSPMLMVCYTNHALDQFLEKVMEFLPKSEIIRVGGRCKSEQLQACNLKLFTKMYRRRNNRDEIQNKISKNSGEVRDCKIALTKADSDVMEFKRLECYMHLQHTNQLYRAVFPPKASAKCKESPNIFKLWLCNNKKLNHLNQRVKASKESENDERQDGSILPQDDAGEEADRFYCPYSASFPALEHNTKSGYVKEELLVPFDEQSAKDSPKENATQRATKHEKETMPIFEAGQAQSYASPYNLNRSFVELQQIVPEHDLSNSQKLHNDLCLPVPLEAGEVPIAAITEHLEEPIQLSNFVLEEDPEADEQTIIIEDEASRLQNERCIEGDEEYTLVIPQQSHEESREDQGDIIEENSDFAHAAYEHGPFVWQTMTKKCSRGGQATDSENSQRQAKAETPTLKSHDEISLKEDISKEEDPEADEQTIIIENEASRIQNERCIEGDEEYTLVIPQQSHEESQEDQGEIIEENNDFANAAYEHGPFVWQTMTKKCSRGGQATENENSQGQAKAKTQTLKSHDEISLKEDISKIQPQLQKSSAMTDAEAKMVTNIWDLSAEERLRLYLYWVECYRERLKLEIQRGEQKHEDLCAELKDVCGQEEEEVIRRATVVGMTTSGAARYHSMLQRIAPKIVIIEEAAEVMEAHIITSLSRDTKHTILIGDHKQLRPKATVYGLAQKYNLEISLFERMVLNNMECKRLDIQHRMRPEIAALTKRIYEHTIVDHESVCNFDDISGLRHNLFFINHCQPELPVRGLQSFSNPHEADFLVALCRYLLLQGYKREQITILTMYTGQLLELKKRLPRREFEGVKVCVVDNFQGEENDVILLSLVRSNSKIGFLKESNRVCVSLSRARQGFYCIGNFTLLKNQCPLWKEICDDLETKKAIGQALTLVCKRHNHCNEVKTCSDFRNFPLGGCNKVCGERLDCGHACDRMCHPTDKYHEPGRCPKECFTTCPNEHQCQKRCHHPIDCFCAHRMLKIIPKCGHEQIVKCHIEPKEFVCQVKCEKTLACGHKCEEVCGNHCTRRCKVVCNKSLPCGHKKDLLCYQDTTLYSRCNYNCNKVLECGHPCPKKCTETCCCNTIIELELSCKHFMRILCPLKDQPPRCVEECCRDLQCGHRCPGLCYKDCSKYRCEILVEKLLPCDHKKTIPCYVDPREATCQEACQKMCERGHPCRQQCHFGLPCRDCKVVMNMTIPSCEHNIEMPCFRDPAALICKKPCERLRLCGHPCRNVCGKNCEVRPCMKLVPRTLPCKHRVTLVCHKNPETYRCKANVVVDQPCGHKKSMNCYAVYVGLQNVVCGEKVERDLPCHHKVVLPCHTNPEVYKCKRKVEVQMTCGHTKAVICSSAIAGRQELPCMVLTTRTLPCEHEVTIPCCKSVEEYSCQEKVDVILPCKHKKFIECSKFTKGLDDVTCDALITKELPCGHKKEMLCFLKAEEVFCDAPCEQILSCRHPCRGRCGDECSTLACAERVEKSLACGYHKLSCLCSEDVSQVVCLQKCKRKLPCGHYCIGKCSERCSHYKCKEMVTKKLDCQEKHPRRMPCYKDPRSVVCLKRCSRKLHCGHPCKGVCGQPCETVKCMWKIELTFSCRHKQWLSCFERKTAICKAPCLRPKGSCKHSCKGFCGEPCSKYPCKVPVTKRLRCGHNIRMRCSDNPENVQCPAVCGKEMECGHHCSGTCNNCQRRGSHEICKNPCSRLLVCLHRCKSTCYLPCPPCVDSCTRKCPHDKCKKPCSSPCQPCRQPCTWSCPHGQCNNLCGEECDRLPCNAPCPKTLPCSHLCIGLCGENCPTLCAICHSKKLSSMLGDGRANNTEATRCLQLFDCGHIIRVTDMDAWMLQELGNDVKLMRCPKCSTAITFSCRYGNIIKRALKNIENVKAQVQHLAYEVVNSVHHARKDLRLLNYDVKKLKFPQTVLRVIQTYPCNMRDILLIFTLKNHLTIIRQAQATQKVLANMRTAEANNNQQTEVEQPITIITDALEKIKEYLAQPQLHLKTLSQVHEHTRKIFLFSHVLEVQSRAIMHQIPISSMGTTRLKKVRDLFLLFLQGNDAALDLEWLGKIVNSLRTEVNLPPLPAGEAKDFANFPGYQSEVWKMCREGHVYYTGLIARGGEEIRIGGEGCTQCRAIDSDQIVQRVGMEGS